LVQRIEANYHYYRELFNAESRSYRNDYAFAMADRILNGYTSTAYAGIPWSMMTIDYEINSIDVKDNMFVVRNKDKAVVIPKTNLHVMSKEYLLSDNCKQLIENTK